MNAAGAAADTAEDIPSLKRVLAVVIEKGYAVKVRTRYLAAIRLIRRVVPSVR